MAQELYATPEMVKQFRQKLIDKNGDMPDFLETLYRMREEGELSETPLEIPMIDGYMTKEDFIKAYDKIPFSATRMFRTDAIRNREHHNKIIFPTGRNVIAVQHIHDFGFRKQPYINCYAATFLYKGTCQYIFDQDPVALRPGDLCIVTPQFAHAIHTSPDTFAIEMLIREDSFPVAFHDFLSVSSRLSDFFGATINKRSQNYCIIHTDPEDDELRFYLQSFARETTMRELYFDSCAISLLKLFFSCAFRRYGETMTCYQSDFRRRIDAENILRFIQNNYIDITLDRVSEVFHYNKTYLSRYIREHFGKTFMELVTEIKLEHAKEYLRNTDKHISDIALLSGYDTADHFSRMFRKYCGMSPAAWRKEAHML